MSKKKPQLNWSEIDHTRVEVTKTLLINIRAIRDLLLTDGIDKSAGLDIVTQITTTLEKLSSEFTERLKAIHSTHVHLTGKVSSEQTNEYMYFAQQYHNLHTDILTMVTGLSRALVVVQERIKQEKAEQNGIDNQVTH